MQPMEFDHIEGIVLPSQNPFFFGHEAALRFLRQTRGEGRLHHAMLFEGPRGIGKATLAFHLGWNILADTDGDVTSPDISSAAWHSIGQGAHPGLLHISRGFDEKTRKFRSAITVEDIRRIARFVQQTAAGSLWRIIIIDSADDMNRNAANALLKTLEEPPARTLFILIAHHPGRLLPTIRSRCQPLVFRPLDDAALQQALSHVAGPVGFDADDTRTEQLTSRAEGSVRQAILILAAGGLEIARSLDDIISPEIFSVREAYRLASVLGGRDATVHFDFFLDCLTENLAACARDSACAGQVEKAGRISQFWHDMQQDMAEALAYNLDRKQLVIVVLQKVHSFLHRVCPGGQN